MEGAIYDDAGAQRNGGMVLECKQKYGKFREWKFDKIRT